MTLAFNNTNRSNFSLSSATNYQSERFQIAFTSPNPKKIISVQPQSAKYDKFQEREQIGQFDKYRVIMGSSFGSTIDVWVNGKKYEGIQIDKNSSKVAIVQKITQLVNNGSFKQVSLIYGEKADGSGAHFKNNSVTIAAFSESEFAKQYMATKNNGNYENSTIIGNVKTVYGLEMSLGVAAAARGKNGDFDFIRVNCHGGPDGSLYVGNEITHARGLVNNLVRARTLKKGGTIEFMSCLVAQDFNSLRDAANEFGITIKANNYIAVPEGVCGGNDKQFSSFVQCEITEEEKRKYRIPVNPCTLTFTPKGVFDPWGTRVTEIKYRN
jgi:hypothetical protein